jgi:hypothetical protein
MYQNIKGLRRIIVHFNCPEALLSLVCLGKREIAAGLARMPATTSFCCKLLRDARSHLGKKRYGRRTAVEVNCTGIRLGMGLTIKAIKSLSQQETELRCGQKIHSSHY